MISAPKQFIVESTHEADLVEDGDYFGIPCIYCGHYICDKPDAEPKNSEYFCEDCGATMTTEIVSTQNGIRTTFLRWKPGQRFMDYTMMVVNRVNEDDTIEDKSKWRDLFDNAECSVDLFSSLSRYQKFCGKVKAHMWIKKDKLRKKFAQLYVYLWKLTSKILYKIFSVESWDDENK